MNRFVRALGAIAGTGTVTYSLAALDTPILALVVVVLVLAIVAVCWVVASKERTRHLGSLITAVRRAPHGAPDRAQPDGVAERHDNERIRTAIPTEPRKGASPASASRRQLGRSSKPG